MNPSHNKEEELENEGEEAEEFIDEDEIGEEVILENDAPPPEEDDEAEAEEEGMDEIQEAPTVVDLSIRKYQAHTDAVYSVSINPLNPQIFASGGGDDVAYIWSLGSSAPLFKLTGHKDTVSIVSFSPTNPLLATASMDAACKIWNPATGDLLHTLEGPSDSIETIVWHSKGPVLFAGGADGMGWMWNASSGKVMHVFSGHSDSITKVKFSPDGKKVLTASSDATIRVWDPKTAQTLHLLKSGGSAIPFHDQGITSLICHPDASTGIAVSGCEEGRTVIFNYNTGKLLGAFTGHTMSVESLSFVVGHSLCVSASLDKTIQVWDFNTQSVRSTMTHDEGVVKVIPYSQPHLLLSCSLDKSICLWDVRNGQAVRKLTGHTDQVLDIDAVNDTIISAGQDNTLCLWDTK